MVLKRVSHSNALTEIIFVFLDNCLLAWGGCTKKAFWWGVKIVGKLSRISMKSHYMFATRKVHYGANYANYTCIFMHNGTYWQMAKWQPLDNTYMYISQALYQMFQTTKINFEKTVRLTSFQKPWLQSVLISFRFVHLYLLLIFWAVLCFTQFGGRTTVSNLINFMIKPL